MGEATVAARRRRAAAAAALALALVLLPFPLASPLSQLRCIWHEGILTAGAGLLGPAGGRGTPLVREGGLLLVPSMAA